MEIRLRPCLNMLELFSITLLYIFFSILFYPLHLPTPTPTTHDLYTRPTTHDPRPTTFSYTHFNNTFLEKPSPNVFRTVSSCYFEKLRIKWYRGITTILEGRRILRVVSHFNLSVFWPMKRCRLVSAVKLITFLAPYEHVLITCFLSFWVFRGSVFYF